MKLIILSALALFSSSAFAASDCAIIAESYIVDMDSTQPAQYMGLTREGDMIFRVNAQLRGQKSIFEVILKQNECEYVSTRSL